MLKLLVALTEALRQERQTRTPVSVSNSGPRAFKGKEPTSWLAILRAICSTENSMLVSAEKVRHSAQKLLGWAW